MWNWCLHQIKTCYWLLVASLLMPKMSHIFSLPTRYKTKKPINHELPVCFTHQYPRGAIVEASLSNLLVATFLFWEFLLRSFVWGLVTHFFILLFFSFYIEQLWLMMNCWSSFTHKLWLLVNNLTLINYVLSVRALSCAAYHNKAL